MLDAALTAIQMILTPEGIAFLLLGVSIGIVFGAIPGLGGMVGVALIFPLTFGMDSHLAFILLGSLMGGLTFGGSIPAILLNVPGTPPNAATLIDGHPLAQQGRGEEALGASAFSSAAGAIFGLIVLVASIPIVQHVLGLFGPPEYFWLAIMGLTVIAVVTEGAFVKNLISGALGLMITFIGYSTLTGDYRYGFGSELLWDGFDLIPMIIGMFAIAEVIKLTVDKVVIADDAVIGSESSVVQGIKASINNWGIILRSSIVGVVVGLVPGVGGTLATFISYAQTKATSKDTENFGSGDIRGVIAVEATNDAKDGGTLIPTVAFGIPGNALMAVLLGAFILHGIQPGEDILGPQLSVLFVVVFSLLISNIITSAVGVSVTGQIVKITRINPMYFIPVILIVCFYASYVINYRMFDIYAMLLFGILGYVFIVLNYSRIVFVIAFVLAPLAEQSFVQTVQLANNAPEGNWVFVNRPLSALLILVVVATVAVSVRGANRNLT